MRVVMDILLGLAIPIVWGLGSAWAFEWLRNRQRRRSDKS